VPGLTGWAQINGPDELLIHQKVDLDVEYLLHQSMWIDIKIIWLTFIKVLKKMGSLISGLTFFIIVVSLNWTPQIKISFTNASEMSFS